MGIRKRQRAKPVSVVINTDYSENLPGGLYRTLNIKMSGTYTGSGAGTNALDGPFNLLGRIEFARGEEPIIGLHGTDLRHLSAFLQGGHAEILPASITTSGSFLAQAELPLDRLISGAAIDARQVQLVGRGRFRGLTNLGTTVTAISTGKLRLSGETTELPNGDHFEPRFVQSTIDMSATSSDLNTTKRIGNDVELCAGVMIRTYDASLELGDPNTSRSDGMIREVRIDLERNGETQEIGRWSWAELKQMSTSRWGINAATGQISTGVVFISLDDPNTPELDETLRLQRGDALIVRVDNAATIEDEFTATTPAAGDLAYVSFLNFVPQGPGVEHARRLRYQAAHANDGRRR